MPNLAKENQSAELENDVPVSQEESDASDSSEVHASDQEAETGSQSDDELTGDGTDSQEETDDEPDDEEDAPSLDLSKVLAKKRKTDRENKSLRTRVRAAEDTVLRYEACERNGLPLNLAKRLSGSTAEELDKDAAELMKLIGARRAPGLAPDDGKRRGDGDDSTVLETDHEKIGARMFR